MLDSKIDNNESGDILHSKSREKSFHEARYSSNSDPRAKLSSFYSITGASTVLYRSLISRSAYEGGNILEYGCGPGKNFELYNSLGCNIYGIDISYQAIRKAKDAAELGGVRIEYIVGDAEETAFPSDYFQIIVGTGIVHHLDFHRAFTELVRLTSRDGVCIFIEPLGHNFLINLFRALTPILRTEDEHPLTANDLAKMNEYFEDVSVTYFYLFTLLAIAFRKVSLFSTIYKSLLRFDNTLFALIPSLRKYAWICVVELRSPKKQGAIYPSVQ